MAARYDETFGISPTGRLFRFRLAERIAALASPPARVLDLGCGTGEDALWLAGQGFAVHGIDESKAMIELARAKAAKSGSAATFECRNIETLSGHPTKFDVVMSNFGALSCVPLGTWSAIVPSILAPSGRAFVVLLGRRPFPETIRRGFRSADRGSSAQVSVASGSVRVHYDSVSVVRESLERTSVVDRVEALGCLVPGSGYAGFSKRHPIAVGALAGAECVLRTAPFFRGRGDHTLYEFRPK